MFLFLGTILLFIIVIAVIYNGISQKQNVIEDISIDIDHLLQQRYQLIPHFVVLLDKYITKEEADVLRNLMQIRAKAISHLDFTAKAKEEKQISNKIHEAIQIAKDKPKLNADDDFLNLQKTLHELDKNITKHAQSYNENVREFNTLITIFPNNVVAVLARFKKKDFFNL